MTPSYLAFYDVDYTIVACSSGAEFGRELLRGGVIGWREIAHVAGWQALYAAGLMREVAIWERATAGLIGKPESAIRAACLRAHENRVRHRIYRDARASIERHRAAGAAVVLVSAAPRVLVEALAAELGVEHAGTCWANVVDGLVHGLERANVPYGPVKMRIAERVCRERDVDPALCWAYGDSRSDADMLSFVGNPVAVNPKRALAREARARGWRVVRWREAGAD